MTGFEKFWYYATNILTLGYFYFIKVATKKAMSEGLKVK